MGREHIEFIQAQVLPWERPGRYRPDTQSKTLSRDPATGAASLVLQYSAGWAAPERFSLAAAEEFYLLAGQLSIADACYQPGDYAYLPAGYVYQDIRAGEDGAVALTFFSAEPVTTSAGAAGTEGLIERLATRDMSWDSDVDPRVVGSAPAKKTLRLDPVSGDSTWILRIGATDPSVIRLETPLEKHPYVEEMYQLDGEISTNVGVMRRGAYFWRPPFISHGPIASWPGFMALFRSHGGARMTEWSAQKYPVVWDPPYAPVLPERLRQHALQPFSAFELF